MINKNIFNMVINKVALNIWKERVKRVGKEYKKIYEFDNDYLKGIICVCLLMPHEIFYDWKRVITSYYRYKVCINEVKICIKCGYLTHYTNGRINISKNYHYTSGM